MTTEVIRKKQSIAETLNLLFEKTTWADSIFRSWFYTDQFFHRPQAIAEIALLIDQGMSAQEACDFLYAKYG